MNLLPVFTIWLIVGGATAALALYRKFISQNEQDIVRLGSGEEKFLPEQNKLARTLPVIDRWGKALTTIAIALGLILAVAYLYKAFIDTNALHFE